MLSWDEIVQMDEEALNLAVKDHCAPHSIRPTALWDAVMLLAWRQRICLVTTNVPGTWIIYADELPGGFHLYATTQHEARVAICRLALWRATCTTPTPGIPPRILPEDSAALRQIQAEVEAIGAEDTARRQRLGIAEEDSMQATSQPSLVAQPMPAFHFARGALVAWRIEEPPHHHCYRVLGRRYWERFGLAAPVIEYQIARLGAAEVASYCARQAELQPWPEETPDVAPLE